MGMAGCGEPPPDQYLDDEPLVALEKLEVHIVRNEQGEVILVDLDEIQITDSGLVHLVGLTKLQTLSLGATQVTDVELEHLKRLTNLQSLNVGRTQVTDAGHTIPEII